MSSKLIEMDGIVFEAEVTEEEAVPLSGNAIEKVTSKMESLKPILVQLCKPFSGIWEELNTDIDVSQAEISLGIGFLGEGNIFISKAQASTNLNVKIVFKPKS